MSTFTIKILAIFLVILLVFVFFFQNLQVRQRSAVEQHMIDAPRSIFSDINMTLLSSKNIQYFLNAQEVSRHDDGSDEFVGPDLRFTQANTQWRIRSQRATSVHKQHVTFEDGVSVMRTHPNGVLETLRSDQLRLDLETHQLSSPVAVDYQSTDTHVKASNMVLWLDTEKLQLSGRVRGEYATP